MKIKTILLLSITLRAGIACAQPFELEQNASFIALPAHVEQSIIHQKDGAYDEEIFTSCKLVGAPVSLSGTKSNDGYIASTNGCGGGSAAFPVWLVKSTDHEAQVVLSSGATLLEIADTSSNGLRDIILTQESAGTCEKDHFQYNGTKYVSHRLPSCNGKPVATASAKDAKPPVGSFGFNWLKPETAKCQKLKEADIKRFKSCQPGGEEGGFGTNIKSTHTCQVNEKNEWNIYATRKDCQIAFETIQANAP